jgi:hypothetical protein
MTSKLRFYNFRVLSDVANSTFAVTVDPSMLVNGTEATVNIVSPRLCISGPQRRGI